MKTTIYYFTGTGNSLKVAKDLSLHLKNVELVRMCHENLLQQPLTDADTIGFVLPTIFSGIPKLVGQFIQHLKITNHSPYIFTIVTHGDYNGMGITFEQIEKLLAEKELSLSACFGVQMPHNVPEKDHVTTAQEKELLFKEETIRIPMIIDSIRKRELIPHKIKKFKRFFEHIIYNRMNKSASKKPLDKGFCVDEKCINCSICSKVCPANNIEMVNSKPKWKLENCQFCFACVQWCPSVAIQYEKRTVNVERYHHPEIKAVELFNGK